MLAGVGTTGVGLEVALVGVGFLFVAESDGGFDVPRSIFSCVRNLSGVVASEAFVEILSHACIMVLPGGGIAEDVDVVEAGGGHRGRRFLSVWGMWCVARGWSAVALTRYGVTASAFYGAAPHKKVRLGSPKGLPSRSFFSEKTEAGGEGS